MDTRRRKILHDHLPEGSMDLVTSWLEQFNVSLTITRKRNTKMGDYRPPLKRSYHRISVNGDLQPVAFLVILVHELAHLVTWEKYQRTVRPHGDEWKDEFRRMLAETVSYDIFSSEEKEIVENFIVGKISYRTFNMQFEKKVHDSSDGDKGLMLSEIPVNAAFSLYNGRTFVKLEKLRTRYRCREIKTGRLYLISGLAKVRPERVRG